MEVYSLKPNKSGQSVGQVLGEAVRDPLFSQHIDNPKPPSTIFGGDISELKVLHEEMVKNAATPVMVKGKQRFRAIRKDRNTLFTFVASYPVKTEDLDRDETGETRRMYEKWKEANITFLREEFGAELKTVIEHTDEEHPHIHAYILPDEEPGIFADQRHPGKIAKADAAVVAQAQGLKGKELTKVTNNCYKASMRDWQDHYYEQVGAPCGLTRDGPKRRRTSRSQWRIEKATAMATAKVFESVEQQKADGIKFRERFIIECEINIQDISSREEAVIVREKASTAKEMKIKKREENLRTVLNVINELIGRATDFLGIGKTLQGIVDAINDANLEPESKPKEDGDGLSM